MLYTLVINSLLEPLLNKYVHTHQGFSKHKSYETASRYIVQHQNTITYLLCAAWNNESML